MVEKEKRKNTHFLKVDRMKKGEKLLYLIFTNINKSTYNLV